jgi:TolB-like protein
MALDRALEAEVRPLLEHPELGLTLHPFELATNKLLALVGHVEAREDRYPAMRRGGPAVLLDRAGDRAGAIRAYEELAARLAIEYETTPSPETQALVEAIRQREGTPSRELSPPLAASPPLHPARHAAATAAPSSGRIAVAAASEAGGAAVATHPAPASYELPLQSGTPALELLAPPVPVADAAPVVARKLPRVTVASAVLGAVALVATLVAVLVAVLVARRGDAGSTASSVDVLAVLPFSYNGSRELAYLGDGLPRLLSANLNGAGQLRTIDPVALERAAGSGSGGERGREAAARLGAGLVVSGQVVEAAGAVRITADVARAAGGGESREQIVVDGRSDRLFELVDELTQRLVAAWGAERGQRLTSLAARTTRSLSALHAYLEGEREYAAGRYTAAVDAFQRAIAADSGFALAYYRLSSALSWTDNPRTLDVASNARRLASRLSRRDSLLVEARFANSSGRPELAEPLYRQVLADHPDELEAWLQLGEVQFHWAALFGRPASVAESAFTRGLAIDTTNVPALVHLARIAAVDGRGERVDSLVARVTRLAPGTFEALEVEAVRAFMRGAPAERARVVERLTALRDARLVRGTVGILAATSGNPAAVLPLVRAADAPDRTAGERVLARLVAAELELARGRWGAARALVHRAGELFPARGAQ